ncbi:MAG: dihydrofolate synthase/folylpolyglutamate synthase [Lentimonas sp.]|jgi:dihydrofolate synthase/folylpolyglutamate synthase
MNLPFWPNPLGYRNIEFGLGRVLQLLERLDNPHLKLPPTIHLAGTNGKGSTLAFLKAIFEDANFKVHSYTSPHLVRFNERIVLAGKEIEDDFLNEILSQCKKAAEIPPKIAITFFEGITVAAFLAFSKIKADVLLLEVGMGGRLDATNVIENPLVTIITPIALDHTEFLGKTLAKIAFEKGGIIKPNCPVVISKQKPAALKSLKKIAANNICHLQDKNSHFNGQLGLKGNHQKINATCAIATISAQNKFKISQKNIENGLKNVIWPARLQEIKTGKFKEILPKNFQLILDGSHNKAGARTIRDWLKTQNLGKNYLICAMLKEKDSLGFLKILAPQTEMLIGLKIKDENGSKTAQEICKIASNLEITTKNAEDFSSAISEIKKFHLQNFPNLPSRIIVCGSLYLAGWFLRDC